MQDCHTVEIYVNCSISITMFVIIQRELREASKPTDLANTIMKEIWQG